MVRRDRKYRILAQKKGTSEVERGVREKGQPLRVCILNLNGVRCLPEKKENRVRNKRCVGSLGRGQEIKHTVGAGEGRCIGAVCGRQCPRLCRSD